VRSFISWCTLKFLWSFDVDSTLALRCFQAGRRTLQICYNYVVYSAFSAPNRTTRTEKCSNRRSLKWRLKKFCKKQNLLSLFSKKKSSWHVTLKELFSFCKNDTPRNLEAITNLKKIHFQLQIISPTTSVSIVLKLWITLHNFFINFSFPRISQTVFCLPLEDCTWC
jgi:hypothetical protein